MRKLEASTKRRFLPQQEEVKFPEFLGVEVGQVEKVEVACPETKNLDDQNYHIQWLS